MCFSSECLLSDFEKRMIRYEIENRIKAKAHLLNRLKLLEAETADLLYRYHDAETGASEHSLHGPGDSGADAELNWIE